MYITPATTPLSTEQAARRLARLPGLAWLDGGLSHGREGRYSFVGAAPTAVVSRAAGDPRLLEDLSALGAVGEALLEDAESVDDAPRAEDVPRWIGSLSYDALAHARHEPHVRREPHARAEHPPRISSLPGLRFARYDALYAMDHGARRSWLVGDDVAACERLRARLSAAAVDDLHFAVGALEITDATAHKGAIRTALEHIREGDIYQINLARRFRSTFQGAALGLFMRMHDESPVPLGLFVDAGDHALLGRSMERFLRFRRSDGSLATSPIKGTLQRDGQDAQEAATLRADPKEHAEHAMIVDLMRNDLGRIADYGSVIIDELMAVLPFAGLSHLVSTVSARTDRNLSLGTLLAATFPPGSVTGTPKQRAIQIIAELEPFERGLYTGAYGFIDRAGGCSLAVAIRTAVIEDELDGRRSVSYFAGGGIVEASDPDRETAETELKAQVFLRALGD